MTVSEENRARREKLVSDHIAAENRQDVESTIATFQQPSQARYDVVPSGEIAEGAESVRRMLQGIFAGFPDFNAKRLRTHHAEDAVIVEVEVTGTHQGFWAGLQPTGKRMSVRMAAIFSFEGTDLVGETLYFDTATIMKQLGAL